MTWMITTIPDAVGFVYIIPTLIKFTGSVINKAKTTQAPYKGELGQMDKTLIVPNPTQAREIKKDILI